MEVFLAMLAVAMLSVAVHDRLASRRVRRLAVQAADEAAHCRRLLHLGTEEIRAVALGLEAEVAAPAAPGLRVQIRRLLRLSEDLGQEAGKPAGAPRLVEEKVLLAPLLALARGQVADQLGRGNRVWRVAPSVAGVMLIADRRALHQVLQRVLGSAVLASREGDWIDIAASVEAGLWQLSIVDEGRGLALEQAGPDGPESRGIGFGLSLARRLMQAHGGALTLESMAGVGTRVRLSLPAWRMMSAPANDDSHDDVRDFGAGA